MYGYSSEKQKGNKIRHFAKCNIQMNSKDDFHISTVKYILIFSKTMKI